MKKPIIPPNLDFKKLDMKSMLHKLGEIVIAQVQGKVEVQATDKKGRYLHWDQIKYRKPPEGLNTEQWWFATKLARRSLNATKLPFKDLEGNLFSFVIPNALLPKLAILDRKAGGHIASSIDYNRDKYLINSLIEESISSSQLEGASTTRRVAKDMLLSQRKPRTPHELMIFNNYRAMQFMRANKDQKLTIDLILEVHHILTEGILKDAGYLRTHDEIHITDTFGEILHTPPKFTELTGRLEILCDFANTDETKEEHYIHPVIKAILLHFVLAYDHPFNDGNGRTARILFYWFMLNRGYWLMEYISISRTIKEPGQYGKAFLYTETDENDVTYFIFHQLKVILQAMDALYDYINEQKQEIEKVEKLLHSNVNLNHRQLALIQHALKNPTTRYVIEHHRQSHNITYQTARTDLLKLEELKLLTKREIGKTFVFTAPENLNEIVKRL